MPIRIKPIHYIEPCVLDMASIRGICKLVDENFNLAKYSAEDGVWEAYDEVSTTFLEAISETDNTNGKPKHETLDAFIIKAQNLVGTKTSKSKPTKVDREIEIIFNRKQATIKFSGPYQMEDWFDYFVINLKKHLRSPTFRQKINVESGSHDMKPSIYPSGWVSNVITSLFSTSIDRVIEVSKAPYCTIILYKKSPNVLAENIKAGLITNFIWVPVVFVLGILVAILAYWIWNKYNINIYDWVTPPSIPTNTAVP